MNARLPLVDRPLFIQFDFANVPVSAPLAQSAPVTVQQSVVQGDFEVYGIVMLPSSPAAFTTFDIEIRELNQNFRLMDEPIRRLVFQRDCQSYLKLPSKLWICNHSNIQVRLQNFDFTNTVTTQLVLLGGIVSKISPEAFKRQPYFYSYYFELESETVNALATNPNQNDTRNRGPTLAVAKPPLDWDFELTDIIIDDETFRDITQSRNYSIEVFNRSTQKMLFRSPQIQTNCSGGNVATALAAVPGSVNPVPGYPATNTLNFRLSKPEFVKQGSQLDVRASIDLTYAGAEATANESLDQLINVVLLGNRLLKK